MVSSNPWRLCWLKSVVICESMSQWGSGSLVLRRINPQDGSALDLARESSTPREPRPPLLGFAAAKISHALPRTDQKSPRTALGFRRDDD